MLGSLSASPARAGSIGRVACIQRIIAPENPGARIFLATDQSQHGAVEQGKRFCAQISRPRHPATPPPPLGRLGCVHPSWRPCVPRAERCASRIDSAGKCGEQDQSDDQGGTGLAGRGPTRRTKVVGRVSSWHRVRIKST